MTTWTILSRLGMTGAVTIDGTALRWNITSADPVLNFTYGASNMIPLLGDWNGDGVEGIGAYNPSDGAFHLRQTASTGGAERIVGFGNPDLTPLSWYDESGSPKYDGIGITDGSNVFLDKNFTGGPAAITTTFSEVSCPSSGTVGQCTYTEPAHTTWTIDSRLRMTGTVTIDGIALRWNITSADPVLNFTYGASNMIPLVGDWNGDGVEGIGAYDPSNGSFHLRQAASTGNADLIIGYGAPDLTPLSWYDESGSPKYDGIGIIDGSVIRLDKNLTGGVGEINATTTDISCPISTVIGQCTYTIPVYATRTILSRLGMVGTVVIDGTALRWNITSADPVLNFTYGASNMIPLVGDWNGDGVEGIGAYDPSNGLFHLRQTASTGDANFICNYGAPGLVPISWYDESGSPKYDGIGTVDRSVVHLDKNLSCATSEINTTRSHISCYSPTVVRQCTYTAPPVVIPPAAEAGMSPILIGGLAAATLAIIMSKKK